MSRTGLRITAAAWSRLTVLLLIVVLMLVPIIFLIWRSRHQSPEQLIERARKNQAAGRAQQASIELDRAVAAAETPAARRDVLREVADIYRARTPENQIEALSAYSAAIAVETRILQEVPSDANAADHALGYSAALWDAFGSAGYRPAQLADLCQRILSADPARADAADLLIKSQLAAWEADSHTALTPNVIQRRLELAIPLAHTRIGPTLLLLNYLYGKAALAAPAAADGLRQLAAGLSQNFSGPPDAQSLLQAALPGLQAGMGAGDTRILSPDVISLANAAAPQLTDAEVAGGWLRLLSSDRSLTWSEQKMQAQGDLDALAFFAKLPEEIRAAPILQCIELQLLWRLSDPTLSARLDAILATPKSLDATPAAIRAWGLERDACLLKLETLAADPQLSLSEKMARLDDLAAAFAGSISAGVISGRAQGLKALLQGWGMTAACSFLAEAKAGNTDAILRTAQLIQLAGGDDLAYPLFLQMCDGQHPGFSGRERWMALRQATQYEITHNKINVAIQRMKKLEPSWRPTPQSQMRLALEYAEIAMLAKQGKKGEAEKEFTRLNGEILLPELRDAAETMAARAAVLAELGRGKEAAELLGGAPLTPTVAAVWPGPETGNQEAWNTLLAQLAKGVRNRPDSPAGNIALALLANPLASRQDIVTITGLLSELESSGATLVMIERLCRTGHLDDAERLIRIASASATAPPWLPALILKAAIHRGDWQQANAALADAAVTVDPIAIATDEVRIMQGQGNHDAAEARLDGLLKTCTFSPELWLLKGHLAESRGAAGFADARKAYEMVQQLNSWDSAAAPALYRLLVANGEVATARQILGDWLVRQGRIGDLPLLADQGTAIDLGVAIHALEELARADRLLPSMRIELMQLYWRANRPEEARSIAEDLVSEFPDRLAVILPAAAFLSDPAAERLLASYCSRPDLAAGDNEYLAIASYWQARGNPKLELAALDSALAVAGSAPARRSKAAWHMRHGEFEPAMKLLEAAWQKDPAALTGLQLAETAAAMGNTDRAMAVIQSLQENSPFTGKIALIQAQILAATDPVKALGLVEEHLAASPGDPWGWYCRAIIRFDDLEAIAQVRDDLQRAVHLAPGVDTFRLKLADWFVLHGNPDAATSVLTEGNSYNPGSAQLGAAKVVAMLRDNNLLAACDAARDLTVRFPRVSYIQRLPLHVYLSAGRYLDALAIVEQFLQDSPDSIVEMNNAAHLLAVTGKDLPRALQLSKKAITLTPATSPYTPFIRDTQTVILVASGQFEDAIREAGDLSLAKTPAQTLYLAAACAAVGRVDDANRLTAAVLPPAALSTEWYLALADLAVCLPPQAASAMLPIFTSATESVQEKSGSVEVAARMFAALATVQRLAGSPRAQVLASVRRSSSLWENPWASLQRAAILLENDQSADARAAARETRAMLELLPIPVLQKSLNRLMPGGIDN